MGFIIVGSVHTVIILLVLITSLISVFRVFYSPERIILGEGEYGSTLGGSR